MSEQEKRWNGHLQAQTQVSGVILHVKLGEPDGESFVLTLEEMRHLLDLLSRERSGISHDTHALAVESVKGPLDDLIASFV